MTPGFVVPCPSGKANHGVLSKLRGPHYRRAVFLFKEFVKVQKHGTPGKQIHRSLKVTLLANITRRIFMFKAEHVLFAKSALRNDSRHVYG